MQFSVKNQFKDEVFFVFPVQEKNLKWGMFYTDKPARVKMSQFFEMIVVYLQPDFN